MRDFYEDYDSALIKYTRNDHTVMLLTDPELVVVWFHYDSYIEMKPSAKQVRDISNGHDPVAEGWKDGKGRPISVENATLAFGDIAIKNVAGKLFWNGQRSTTFDQSYMTRPFAAKVGKALEQFEREDEKRIEDIARSLLQEGYNENDIDDLVHTYRVRYNDADRVREYMRKIPHGHIGKSKSKKAKSKTYPKKRVKSGRRTMYLPSDGKGHVPKAHLKQVNSARSPRSLAQDSIQRAAVTYPSPTPMDMAANWIRHPNKYDIEGIDAPKMSRKDEEAYAHELSRTYRDYDESEEGLSYLEDAGYEDIATNSFWKGNKRRASQEREKREWFWLKASEEEYQNRQ